MKIRKLLLPLVLITTFFGGFLAGVNYPFVNETLTVTNNQLALSKKDTEAKEKPTVEATEEKVLIGYVQDFRDPNVVDYENLTHVIFSFAHPTKDGKILLSEPAINNLRKIVTNAQEFDTKVMLAVGGWFHIEGGESYPYFKEAISSAESRSNLIEELNILIETEKLDGIDIDFEHPRSLDDAKNLGIFMKELNDTLKENNKELSIAVHAKVHSVAGTEINNVFYEPSMFHDVDYVNIMAYDGHWDGEYNAANLSTYEFNRNIVNYWIKLFDHHQLSREKLVLGIPSYGQPEDSNIKQVSYGVIIKSNPENAQNNTVKLNGTTYHYNGAEAVQNKTKLALDHGLGGMMLWEVGLDAAGPHSLTTIMTQELKEAKFLTKK